MIVVGVLIVGFGALHEMHISAGHSTRCISRGLITGSVDIKTVQTVVGGDAVFGHHSIQHVLSPLLTSTITIDALRHCCQLYVLPSLIVIDIRPFYLSDLPSHVFDSYTYVYLHLAHCLHSLSWFFIPFTFSLPPICHLRRQI
jgi:hypothetical protein